MLSTSAPAATPQVLTGAASSASLGLSLWLDSSGWAASFNRLLSGQRRPAPAAEERQSHRDARVTRLDISPGDVTVRMYERVIFAAVPFDAEGVPVGGVHFKWRAEHVERGRRAPISRTGVFEAGAPGTYKITVEGARQRAETTVKVLPEGARTREDDQPSAQREVSTRDLPPGLSRTKSRREKSAPRTADRGGRRDESPAFVKASFTKASFAKAAAAPAASAALLMDQNAWNENNYPYADDPGNGRGDPPAGPIDDGAGSGNFQINAPVLTLPGRGIDLGLSLVYNSRVWSKTGAYEITFDPDRDWPAAGWSLGFGKIIGMNTSGSMMLEADNTRHGFTGTVTSYSGGTTYFTGKTTDGTFIDYWTYSYNGAVSSGWARLPNGTHIDYGAPGNGAIYPTRITDANGNYLTITYRNNQGPAISSVVDTLGRTINFHYDANNLLSSVSAPGLSGAARTLVQLQYRWHTLGYNFAGLTPHVRSAAVPVVEAIYYPGTNNGYWFGDGDSYSPYGMIAKVSERKSMGYSGAISAGTETHRETYAYPMDTYAQQSGPPAYQTMTDTWEGGGAAAVTSYGSSQASTYRRAEITHADGSKTVQYSHNSPGTFLDGLVYTDETRDAANNLMQSSTVTWEQGDYSAPRPVRVETTDERGQTKKTEFSYAGSARNQVTETRDYDYGGATLLRRTVTAYEDGANYVNRHIFNLVKSVTTFAGDGTRVSQSEYKYDEGTLADTPGVTMHSETHNPYAPWWEEPCDCWYEYVDNGYGYGYYEYVCHSTCTRTDYDPSTNFRGNVTEIKTYADAAGLTGAVTETRSYDRTGNMIASSSSCCDLTSVSYTDATQYAYPSAQTRGSASDPGARVTTNSAYFFYPGLVHTSTDASGRTSETTYDAATLRPYQSISPTLARTTYSYDNHQLSVTATTTDAAGAVADVEVKYLDGRGRVKREESRAAGANEWDAVETVYDGMGRVWKQSRPYRRGVESPQWAETLYDALGRSKRVIAPDASETRVYYNERHDDPARTTRPSAASAEPGETTLVVDAWGRERWGRNDALGRLVEVVEPDANGGGSVQHNGSATRYAYDTLGNLTLVTQGAQQRKFRYDALGRLTHQKLAEMSATLNAAGAYVGAGGEWSETFTYDQRSNPVSRTDARGVTTSFNYNNDPLNRLQSVSFTVGAAHDASSPIHGAATVTYEYLTNGGGSQRVDVTLARKITAAGVSVEDYQYDAEGRLSEQKLTLLSRPSHPLTTNYTYDTLDRVASVVYPAQYPSGTRKTVTQSYDAASRVSSLQVNNVSYASDILYNASSQTTSINVGVGVGNWKQERYEYDQRTGLLSSQKVTRAGDDNQKLLHLSYDYLRPGTGAGRTGQLTRISDLLNPTNASLNRDRTYEYDALGRLRRATGGHDGRWAQRYHYDRYGNRWNTFSQTAEQLVRNFHLVAFNRQPNATELQQHTAALQTAYWQGQSQLLAQAKSMGDQLFNSAEYAARNRTNSEYVYDLYKAYLNRDPDQGGWNFWTGGVERDGRAAVRDAFVYSEEFSLSLQGMSPNAPVNGVGVGRDGLGAMSFDQATNRINAPGWQYDAAGNQTRVQKADGSAQLYEYDAAGRMALAKDAYGNVIAAYTYGSSNARLVAASGASRTYYAWGLGGVTAEYSESGAGTSPQWSKNNIYLGARLLATQTAAGYGEAVQYHHPDRLGTRLVSNAGDAGVAEQHTLPFGTALAAESTGWSGRVFTSYERSSVTGLDYAVNRQYDPSAGQFTQPDPIGMRAANLEHPQTLNLYNYVGNDPVNRTDPDGLFWGAIKRFFKKVGKIFSAVGAAISRVLNNRWVQIGVFIAGFIVPFLGPGLAAVAKAIKVGLKVYDTISNIASTLQLYGALLQGKLREFGKAIGAGLLSAALATVEDGIIRGVKDSIRNRGISLGAILDGARTGFLDGYKKLRHNLFGRGLQSLIPFYGNFCGPGNVDADTTPAVDGVDGLCKAHDKVYQGRVPGVTRLQADKTLFVGLLTERAKSHLTDRLVNAAFGTRVNGGDIYRSLALPAFGGAIIYRTLR